MSLTLSQFEEAKKIEEKLNRWRYIRTSMHNTDGNIWLEAGLVTVYRSTYGDQGSPKQEGYFKAETELFNNEAKDIKKEMRNIALSRIETKIQELEAQWDELIQEDQKP